MRLSEEPTEEQRDEAALWLAKKTGGSLTRTDAEALEAWLNADLRHRRAFDEARTLYARLEEPARRAAVAPLRRKLTALLQPRRSWLTAASVVAAALVAAWLVNPSIVENWQSDIVTGRQLVSVVRLPDGSTARLGADTAVALDFRASRRRVRLLRGEAYFEVAHGRAGTFTVEANGDEVRDIGTRFNVDVAPERTRVVVTEGAVEVAGRDDSAPVVLHQGHQVVVAAGRAQRVEPADPALALAWMSGRLVVQGATVADVAAALQRHVPGRIVVRGALGGQEVSGTFPLTDVDASLVTLAEAVQGRILHATPWLTVMY
ncbi:FecR family protein [Chelatococcus reniformis]|uniref:Iron dicitrate transporter FecR n=1 Tax=Chelatococcus reniformis TaxID=1494448 RepID=A0A916XND2_9HYPH|nr:FecR domain-containing protein [Chelatococcus reniformis]GGC88973.1 iron dicitrate transporter FecR [Chelatococcus reniformis]